MAEEMIYLNRVVRQTPIVNGDGDRMAPHSLLLLERCHHQTRDQLNKETKLADKQIIASLLAHCDYRQY